MASNSWISRPESAPYAAPGESLEDFRQRRTREQQEAEERRQHELAEQASDLNSPQARIRTWEKRHGVRLPSDPAHAVLGVVAAATRLTLEQVHEEQRQRMALAAQTAAARQPRQGGIQPPAAPDSSGGERHEAHFPES